MRPSNYGPPPCNSPVATFWIDESGSKLTGSKGLYVVAGLKTRHPDVLQRRIQSVREKHSFQSEFKFGRIDDHKLRVFLDVIDALEASDARLMGTVVEPASNPFPRETKIWYSYAAVACQLVAGNALPSERLAVMLDKVTTPRDIALGVLVKRSLNSHLSHTPTVLAMCLDSKANDMLQVADLVAGAIRAGWSGDISAPAKLRVAQQLAAAFGVVDLSRPRRTAKVNIASLREAPRWFRG